MMKFAVTQIIILLGTSSFLYGTSSTVDVNTTTSFESSTSVEQPTTLSDYHSNSTSGERETETEPEHHTIHVASWNFEHVETPLLISVFILTAGIFKLGFHHADFLSSIVPESCMLVIFGLVVAGILHLAKADKAVFPGLSSTLFFLYLLPPIILESAYSLHDRTFFDNLGSVMLYAVIGTVLNCFILGPSLFALSRAGLMGQSMNLIPCLVFSSLVVAVDPVAVLAIFQEVGVNNVLYFLVFGESLFNDAVTVVLYNTMKTFNLMTTITVDQIFLAVAAFFVVSLGGAAVGILFGFMTAFMTKFTEHVRVVEPLAVFILAYISYLAAELFHFSGIISIICCGLVQAQYAFHNISHKSHTTVKYFSKMQSATADCIIFLFLGLAVFTTDLVWDTGFILWTIGLCLVIRFAVVFSLTFLANKISRLREVNLEEQFIMAYGGLRGAVAFSLVDLLDKDNVPERDLFMTATLTLIFTTIFIQGITIKPLVRLLRVTRKEGDTEPLIIEEFHSHVTDHVMAGIEEVLGTKGQHFIREMLEYYDRKYLKHWLQNHPESKDEQLMQLYEKIALRQHFANLAGSKMIQEKYGSVQELTVIEEESLTEEDEGIQSEDDDRLLHVLENPDLIHEEIDHLTKPGEQKQEENKLIDNPTAGDIRDMLVTVKDFRQKKLDKNLRNESEVNLLKLLHDKEQRTKNFTRRFSTLPGLAPGPSPQLSGQRSPGSSPVPRSRRMSVDPSRVMKNYRRRVSMAYLMEESPSSSPSTSPSPKHNPGTILSSPQGARAWKAKKPFMKAKSFDVSTEAEKGSASDMFRRRSARTKVSGVPTLSVVDESTNGGKEDRLGADVQATDTSAQSHKYMQKTHSLDAETGSKEDVNTDMINLEQIREDS